MWQPCVLLYTCFLLTYYSYAAVFLQVLASGTHSISGKNIDPKRAKPRGPEPVKKVFVGGLDPNTSENDVRDYFGQYGTVNNVPLLVTYFE